MSKTQYALRHEVKGLYPDTLSSFVPLNHGYLTNIWFVVVWNHRSNSLLKNVELR